jgi:hypothetical protein
MLKIINTVVQNIIRVREIKQKEERKILRKRKAK